MSIAEIHCLPFTVEATARRCGLREVNAVRHAELHRRHAAWKEAHLTVSNSVSASIVRLLMLVTVFVKEPAGRLQ